MGVTYGVGGVGSFLLVVGACKMAFQGAIKEVVVG